MSWEDSEIQELHARYIFVLNKYVNMLPDVIATLEKFGKHRKELQFLTAELAKYGEVVKDPAELEDKVKAEIEKYNVQNDNT